MRISTAFLSSSIVFFIAFVTAYEAFGDVHVRGYFRKDGTYVRSHYRSDPDGNFWNNWSTYGNVNPRTGKIGTRRYPSDSGGYASSSSGPFGSYSADSYRSLSGAQASMAHRSMSGGYKLTKRPPPLGILNAAREYKEFTTKRSEAVSVPVKDWAMEEKARCELEIAYKFKSLDRDELYEKWLRQILDKYPATEAAVMASSLLHASTLASR